MGKTDVLRIRDVRAAYRVIGECRDVGSSIELWHQRMMEGLLRLIGGCAVNGGEGRISRCGVLPLSVHPVGFDSAAYVSLSAYMRHRMYEADPLLLMISRQPGRLATLTNRQLSPEAEYKRSPLYTDCFGPGGVEHRLLSAYQTIPGRGVSVIHLHRPAGERDFSMRERRLVEFFHAEIGPLVGHALVSATEPTPQALGPRLRQTLVCLLEGDTEKQAAARLGISPATAHQYVTALYRHFGVASRAQLMAHMMKRMSRA